MGMLINPYRLAAAGSPAFSPTSISDLEVWLDASDTSTLYDATSGGSLVTNGNIVRRIEDKSGNGRHFTQSTGTTTRVGIRVDSGLNGLTTLESQSGQTTLIGYGAAFSLTLSAQTVIMVFQRASTTNGQARWFTQMDASSKDSTLLTNSLIPMYGSTSGATGDLGVFANGGSRAVFTSGTSNVWKRRRVVVDSSLITHLWGSSSATYSYSQPSVSYSRFSFLGKDTTTSFTYPYKFAELMMFSRALDATELSDIDDYITDKWGSGLV